MPVFSKMVQEYKTVSIRKIFNLTFSQVNENLNKISINEDKTKIAIPRSHMGTKEIWYAHTWLKCTLKYVNKCLKYLCYLSKHFTARNFILQKLSEVYKYNVLVIALPI